jgi:hypothetical protein
MKRIKLANSSEAIEVESCCYPYLKQFAWHMMADGRPARLEPCDEHGPHLVFMDDEIVDRHRCELEHGGQDITNLSRSERRYGAVADEAEGTEIRGITKAVITMEAGRPIQVELETNPKFLDIEALQQHTTIRLIPDDKAGKYD